MRKCKDCRNTAMHDSEYCGPHQQARDDELADEDATEREKMKNAIMAQDIRLFYLLTTTKEHKNG